MDVLFEIYAVTSLGFRKRSGFIGILIKLNNNWIIMCFQIKLSNSNLNLIPYLALLLSKIVFTQFSIKIKLMDHI